MKTLTRMYMLEKQSEGLSARRKKRDSEPGFALREMEYDAKAMKARLRDMGTLHMEDVKELKAQLRERDRVIAMLQAGYAPLTAENGALRQQVGSLRAEVSALRDALEKSEDRAARLAAMLKKDSSTSDRPPSTDPDFNKAKAESSKEKSGKKVGGQPGHKGHNLKPSPNPDVVVDKMPPETCACCGGRVVGDGRFESRQVFDVKISVKHGFSWSGISPNDV